MSEVLISIIIPAYNYADTLPRAVESVLTQLDSVSADLLVIDDGSTDNTAQVLEGLQAQYCGRLRTLRKPNGGLSSVRNRGIEEAKGQFLVFLDADDEMAPGALYALVEHIALNPQSRLIVGGHWSAFDDGRRSLHIPKPLPREAEKRVRGYLLDKTISLSNGACAMHREVFAPGVYPESLRNAEDIPVFAQVLARFPCSMVEEPLAIIHKHADSMRHDLKQSLASGLKVVDETFAAQRMPRELHHLRQSFLAQRCLSLFRDCYNAKDYANAKAFYVRALRADWRSIARWSYTRKAVRLLFQGQGRAL